MELPYKCAADLTLFGGGAGAGGRNRTGTGLPPTDFLTSYGFHRRPDLAVCGLDYPFTLARSHLRCCPSSLYTFPLHSFVLGAWLGIAI